MLIQILILVLYRHLKTDPQHSLLTGRNHERDQALHRKMKINLNSRVKWITSVSWTSPYDPQDATLFLV